MAKPPSQDSPEGASLDDCWLWAGPMYGGGHGRHNHHQFNDQGVCNNCGVAAKKARQIGFPLYCYDITTQTTKLEIAQIIDELVQCSGEDSIIGSTFYADQHTIPALEALIQSEASRIALEAMDGVLSDYDHEYQAMCKETGEVRKTPNTMFHKIIEARKASLTAPEGDTK